MAVWLVTDPGLAPVCPDCGVASTRVHEYVPTRPRDLLRPTPAAAGVGRVAVVWVKRRWRCGNPDCACDVHRGGAPDSAGARLVERVREQVAQLIGEAGIPVCAAATQVGISWPSAHQALIDRADPVLDTRLEPVEVLGI